MERPLPGLRLAYSHQMLCDCINSVEQGKISTQHVENLHRHLNFSIQQEAAMQAELEAFVHFSIPVSREGAW